MKISVLLDIYSKIFARRRFYKINKLIYMLGLRGIGILNYKNFKISGELSFLQTMKTNINTNMTVFDIGAHHGDYSCIVRKLFAEANIFAFEPHPKTFTILSQNASLYKFNACNFGVGAINEKVLLYDYADRKDSGSEHSTIHKGVIDELFNSSAQSHEVEIVKLDDFIVKNNIAKIDLLKIDVEGNELNVLKGATLSLKNNIINIIHFEFNEMNVFSKTFMKNFFDILPGFDFYRMLPDGLVPIKYSPAFCEIFAYQNIVAINKKPSCWPSIGQGLK